MCIYSIGFAYDYKCNEVFSIITKVNVSLWSIIIADSMVPNMEVLSQILKHSALSTFYSLIKFKPFFIDKHLEYCECKGTHTAFYTVLSAVTSTLDVAPDSSLRIRKVTITYCDRFLLIAIQNVLFPAFYIDQDLK